MKKVFSVAENIIYSIGCVSAPTRSTSSTVINRAIRVKEMRIQRRATGSSDFAGEQRGELLSPLIKFRSKTGLLDEPKLRVIHNQID